jgi:DNA (cytosine-5)-methyltransferase 1
VPIPLIDLFAGPGGLNEGFSRVLTKSGKPAFDTLVSVECEPWAHRTLELRALVRKLAREDRDSDYYRYIRGELSREELFERSGSAGIAAKHEALRARLGASPSEDKAIEERIDHAIKRSKAKEFVLIGGPPCQAYSIAGRSRRARELRSDFESDEKHVLYREYLRIVSKFRPAVFLMENVPGLLSASLSGTRTFDLIRDDLSSAGYDLYPLNAPATPGQADQDVRRFVVRAEEHGVPQARARVFILGLRRDLSLKAATLSRNGDRANNVLDAIKDLPRIRSKLTKETDSGAAWAAAIGQLAEYETMSPDLFFDRELRGAICEVNEHLPLGTGRPQVPKGEPTILHDWYHDPKLKAVLNHNSRGHMRRDLMRYFFWSCYARHFGRSPKLSDAPHYLRPDHGNVQGDATEAPFADRFRVQLGNRPSTTITSHIGKDGHYYIHPDPSQCRSLSVREAARLQTFPDNYFFEGAATDQYRQVGNAVPPYLASKIGNLIFGILNA